MLGIKEKKSERLRSFVDILDDISIELQAQKSKTILLITAVIFSVGALVGSIGISNNAAHQIDADLAASTIRTITVKYSPPSANSNASKGEDSDFLPEATENEQRVFPSDTIEKIHAIETVDYVGMRLELSNIVSQYVSRPLTQYASDNTIVEAVTSEYFLAANLHTRGDTSILDTSMPIAFIGVNLAQTMGIPVTDDTRGLSLEVNKIQYSIAGYVDDDGIAGKTLYIPYQRGLDITGSDVQATVFIKTAIGAGTQVSNVVRYAVMPSAPERFTATQVISAEKARDSVATHMASQATFGGLFLLLLTTFLIANSMIVSVTARTTEIGVRRALGASRRTVALIFLGEGALVGLLGGLGGSALAVWVILTISTISGWSAHMVWLWILLGPVLGASIGVLASAFPALHAAKIQPAIAVRNN
ncbi:MAG: ABC transporter permease [Actinomycetaceae bacterium]|nr:ABC transporter permease [Actinomycetaceae bacterium]